MAWLARDRDIAVIDPRVFIDVAWLGQLATRGTASVSGGVLSASAAEVDFQSANVRPGQVVVIGGAVLEVVEAIDFETLAVSPVRGAGVPVGAGGPGPGVALSGSFSVPTFAAQLALVQRRLLGELGVRAEGEAAQGPWDARPTAGAILNPQDLTTLVALRTLAMVWAQAGALGGAAGMSLADARTRAYRQLADRERQRLAVRIDLDGDGAADVVRMVAAGAMVR